MISKQLIDWGANGSSIREIAAYGERRAAEIGAENYPLLHQNGTIFWLQRDLALLPKDGRPISQRSDLAELYARRAPLYARFADAVIDNNGAPEQTVQQILEVLT